ncbi:MAG: HAMP domain-containing protein [Ilumatobacteraceae bacterium]
MSLRLKFAIAMVALAAGATVAGGAVSYFATNRELRRQVDSSLVDAAQRLAVGEFPGERPLPGGRGDADGDGRYRSFTQILVQIIDDDGAIQQSPSSGELPVGDADRRVAAGSVARGNVRHDVTIDGEAYRMLTVAIVDGGAVQFARSLEETEHTLDTIRDQTLVIVLGVSVVAALVGELIAQQVTRRLVRLTEVATAVAASGDLTVEVPVDGRDETGRLGVAFNGMLSSLAGSKRAATVGARRRPRTPHAAHQPANERACDAALRRPLARVATTIARRCRVRDEGAHLARERTRRAGHRPTRRGAAGDDRARRGRCGRRRPGTSPVRPCDRPRRRRRLGGGAPAGVRARRVEPRRER